MPICSPAPRFDCRSTSKSPSFTHIRSWVEEAVRPEALRRPQEQPTYSGVPEAELFITTAVSSDKVVRGPARQEGDPIPTAPPLRWKVALTTSPPVWPSSKRRDHQRGLNFKPKAIYVCKTNIADDGEKDDASLIRFELRKAPPIRIWRYLVEEKRVIAEGHRHLCEPDHSLQGTKPDEVNLFSKGENDFDDFTVGKLPAHHLQSLLQEGWDDPACYLAYIDKSMGSSIQVEQIIGRVLRQYGATHYENPLLNSAHFFLRVDNKSVFASHREGKGKAPVRRALRSRSPRISENGRHGGRLFSPRMTSTWPCTIFLSIRKRRATRINEIVEDFPTFTENNANTLGEAHTRPSLLTFNRAWEGCGSRANGNRRPYQSGAAPLAREHGDQSPGPPERWPLWILKTRSTTFAYRCRARPTSSPRSSAKEIVRRFYPLSDLVDESNKPFTFGTPRPKIWAMLSPTAL